MNSECSNCGACTKNAAAPSKIALPREKIAGTAKSTERSQDKNVVLYFRAREGVYCTVSPGQYLQLTPDPAGFMRIDRYDRGVVENICTTPTDCRVSLVEATQKDLEWMQDSEHRTSQRGFA